MAGSTLKFAKAVTDFPKLATLPITFSDCTFLLRASMKLLPRQDFGTTNGVHSNFASSWMTLVLNTLALNISTFCWSFLKKFHDVQCNMAGDKLAGIAIQWDYPGKRCRLSMPGYIDNLLLKFKHPHPLKPQLSPYACLPISYGTKTQFSPDEDISALLDDTHKHRIQEIIRSLLYYAHAVDNKLLVALSAIAAKQFKATVITEHAVHLLLDYVAIYPNDSIVYHASDMILCAHADAGFLNESQSHSHAGAHIFLLENDPYPRFNGAVLSIAQIIKFVMALCC
jgi:hypothetical protein